MIEIDELHERFVAQGGCPSTHPDNPDKWCSRPKQHQPPHRTNKPIVPKEGEVVPWGEEWR